MFSLLNNGGILAFLFDGTQKSWFLSPVATEAIFVAISLIAAYLLGSINSAIIVSRVLYGDDVRKHGSGNAGMTNMLRTYGLGAAGLTLLGDLLKTALAIAFAGVVFGFQYMSAISVSEPCYTAGLFAVLGHIFPIFYGFKGGKGVLATATMVLILAPIPFLLLITLFCVVVGISKYVSLGSVTAATLLPVLVNGYYILAFGNPPMPITALSTILLAIIIVWCHRTNLQRISDKTESKISFKRKKKDDDREAE